ncbi:hypothetical protein FACS1894182_08420 [Bacteroidia bacterium]|nr:hypothetical protein FACS1894182_08420 [Bacteroidia bacterium]
MIVYHGSYTKINEIDLSMSAPRKDFGKGFYVTKFRSQAETWAKRIGADNNCEGVVSEFIFYENAFIDGTYRVLRFDKYDEKWLDFVTLNRRKDSPIPAHDYDIVEGPVADDRISENITRYIKGESIVMKFDEFNLQKQSDVEYNINYEHNKNLKGKMIVDELEKLTQEIEKRKLLEKNRR